MLPNNQAVSYCCAGLSYVTEFEVWNASWVSTDSSTTGMSIIAIAAFCSDGTATPYVTAFVDPKVTGQTALDPSCPSDVTQYYVDGTTIVPPAADPQWLTHTFAGMYWVPLLYLSACGSLADQRVVQATATCRSSMAQAWQAAVMRASSPPIAARTRPCSASALHRAAWASRSCRCAPAHSSDGSHDASKQPPDVAGDMRAQCATDNTRQ